jgi:hypothetical protein
LSHLAFSFVPCGTFLCAQDPQPPNKKPHSR